MHFAYGYFGGDVNLEVNGDLRKVDDIAALDGLIVGNAGVRVYAKGEHTGILELKGSITTFKIGGQEFYLSEICPYCEIHPLWECVTFQDLPLGMEIANGTSFISDNVLFDTGSFYYYPEGATREGTASFIEDTDGTHVLWLSNINVGHVFSDPTHLLACVSIRYRYYGGNVNLTVNNDFYNVEDIADLNGIITPGQVQVRVAPLGDFEGMLYLEGPIASFMIGGQELALLEICPYCAELPDEGEGEGEGEPDEPFADCVDFGRLPDGFTAAVNLPVTIQGVTFQTSEFYYPDGSSENEGSAVLSDSENGDPVLWLNNINLGYDFTAAPGLPAAISCVSISYGYFGGDINLEVNGILVAVPYLAELDGTYIGAVQIRVFPKGNGIGVLQLRGAVDSFKIGGQEFYVREICPFCQEDETAAHAADQNGDFIIDEDEADAYLEFWQSGHGRLSLAIRALYLRSVSDGYYDFDWTLDPPECWIPRLDVP
jgi:hypothetical protein